MSVGCWLRRLATSQVYLQSIRSRAAIVVVLKDLTFVLMLIDVFYVCINTRSRHVMVVLIDVCYGCISINTCMLCWSVGTLQVVYEYSV